MKSLPIAQIYEQEIKYMPYQDSLRRVLEIISRETPQNGRLVDLMCGTGYLLNQIRQNRRDLSLQGVDSKEEYVSYARSSYPGINFEQGDVLLWSPGQQCDAAICTGALHHIPYEKQEEVIGRMAGMIKPGGFCLISDCYIDDYANEVQRKLAAAKLGYEYLRETTSNGAPEQVIEATIDILHNDVLMHEFKTSVKKRTAQFQRLFRNIQTHRTWPKITTGYGDYITLLKDPIL